MDEDEILAAIEANAGLQAKVFEKYEPGFTKHLTEGKKMIVTTPEEQLKEYAKLSEPAIKLATRQTHEGYEAKLEKISGVKKLDGESGHAYLDRLSAKLKYLEKTDDTESALYKGLQKELEALKTERQNEKQELARVKIDGEIKGAVNKLKFAVPSHVKKDNEKSAYQKREIEDATDIFNARYTTTIDDKGRFVFTNKKGEAQTEGGEPMTAEAIFARDFAAKLVPAGRSAGGAGSGNDDGGQGGGGADYLGATTEEIRTKLAEKGLGVGTARWKEAYEKAHIAAGYVKTDDGYVKQ
ncbi:hypothetical protein [Spirosoma radiotolerans]|uniref:Uncharacterized protein n=1 Tax=Spirosoma radiotolerans TaxID=1379870 RepID=A0A0E3ZVF9_9BACT|nr:hypothetical protein [Spirosoma radiotolerans]AKD55024.1 hypothetical protein SD10_09025 [Spirosoma radiotolerans]